MNRHHSLQTPRYVLPDIETGYALDPAQAWFSAILPLGVDKTNLVTNPVVGVATTNYVAGGAGTISRDTTVQKFGAASLKVTPGASAFDGVIYGNTTPLNLVAGTQYFASVWFKGTANLQYQMTFGTTGNAALGQTVVWTANGLWQRVSCAYLETSSTTRRILIEKSSQTNLKPFWVGALDCEQDQVTTHIDGDQTGFVRGRSDYYWTGTPHASTSVRLGQCRAGGEVVSFDKFGFHLLSIIGLGLGGVLNQFTPLARGGAYYQGSVITDRQFTLVGQVDGLGGLYELQQKRQALVDLFKADVVSPDQPLVLRYQPTDDCGNPTANEQDIVCVYEAGLSGQTDNLNSERLGLVFHNYLPFVAQQVGNAAASLGYQQTVTNANEAISRSPAGLWAALGSGFNGIVYAAAVDANNGRVYFAGAFTTANGVTVNEVCYWDGTSFNPMGSGTVGVAGGIATALALAPNGDVWVGGAFTTAGGTATKGFAKYSFSGNSWSIPTNTAVGFNEINALAVDFSGNVYAGGLWTSFNGVANTLNLFKYDGTTFTALSTGASANVATLLWAPNNNLYLGGAFPTLGGVTVNGIGYWDGTAFHAMGTGVAGGSALVGALEIIPNGLIYAGGNFTSINGISASSIAVWNGTAWAPLGTGVAAGFDVFALAVDASGTLYVGGSFTSAGGITTISRIAGWNGSAWFPIEAVLPGAGNVNAISLLNNNLYLSYSTAGSATTAILTTVANSGSATVGPRLAFTGPGKLYQLKNYTAVKVIYFNLTLLAGETAVLDLSDPSNITFISTFRGNLLNTILAGSQLSDFALAPGNNSISLLIGGTTSAATAANIQWRITAHSLDGALSSRLLP